MTMRLFLAPLVLIATLAGCPGEPPPPGAECVTSDECPNAGFCVDNKCEPCSFGLPPPNTACVPACGNEIGVGQPCSQGGFECSAWDVLSGEAGICTIDFEADADLQICTRPCESDSECGSASVCQGDPDNPDGDKGCIPASCAE